MAVYMPFGKYKGRPIGEIPPSYLMWLLDNVDLPSALEEAVRQALYGPDPKEMYAQGYREGFAAGRESVPAIVNGGAAIRTEVDRWYREASIRYHPDHDGNRVVMVAINDLRTRLRELVG